MSRDNLSGALSLGASLAGPGDDSVCMLGKCWSPSLAMSLGFCVFSLVMLACQPVCGDLAVLLLMAFMLIASAL